MGVLGALVFHTHLVLLILKKISGYELKYTALVGKPSELTYHHADHLLDDQAKKLGMGGINTIYCIGYEFYSF